ncbi:hypothetical protein GBZ26_15320 [Azospirillum formosense]|uniref:Uncharacterized protein n=1 Tax=Azospirillum formosense TaxID=861533 RepID=A0ABX2L374_9PROT|nr:hypothetical protein [Azospirillum formosense]
MASRRPRPRRTAIRCRRRDFLIFPLPPREREGARAQRGKGEGTATAKCLILVFTLTRRLRRHPLPGRERELGRRPSTTMTRAIGLPTPQVREGSPRVREGIPCSIAMTLSG